MVRTISWFLGAVLVLTVFALPGLAQGGLGLKSEWIADLDTDVDLEQIQSLQDVLLIALVKDKSIQLTDLELASLAASFSGLEASLKPQLNVVGDYRLENAINNPIGRQFIAGPDLEATDRLSTASVAFSLGQQLGPNNQLQSAFAKTQIGWDLALMQREQAVVRMIGNVQQYYYNMLKAYRGLELARLALANAERTLEITEKKVATGVATPLDALRDKNSVFERENQVEAARNGLQISLFGLLQLVGLDRSYLEIGEEWVGSLIVSQDLSPRPWDIPLDRAVQFGLDYRSELASLTKQVELAVVDLDTHDRTRDWKVTLAGRYLYDEDVVLQTSVDTERLLTGSVFMDNTWGLPDVPAGPDTDPWQVTLSATYRFGDGGASSAERERLELEVEKAVLQQSGVADQVYLDIYTQHMQLSQSWRTYQLQSRMLAEAEETNSRLEQLYKLGSVTEKDLLEGQILLASAENAVYTAGLDYRMQQTRLAKAMGVGVESLMELVSSGDWDQINL